MIVIREYPGSHHYIVRFDKSVLHCPSCGANDVWGEQDHGDYYAGSKYVCTGCECDFTIQGPNKSQEDYQHTIIEQLRTQETHEPTTPRGKFR